MVTPESSLEHVRNPLEPNIAYSKDILCFKLVGQNEIGISQQALVRWHYFFADVDLALVAHDGVEHCILQLLSFSDVFLLHVPQKKAPGFVVDANLVSRAILPTCCTTPALGQ